MRERSTSRVSDTRKPWYRRLAALLLIAVASAECSGGGGDSDTAAPAPTETVRIVSQNLLHGIACPDDSNLCDLPGRVALFMRQVEEAGCPELISLQEANERTVSLLREAAADRCSGDYTIVWDDDPGLDREVVLTSLEVLGSKRTRLAGPLRTAFWVRVAADVGVVDFVSSHLASDSDDRPCDRATCPPPCQVDEMINACQARQLVAFASEVAAEDSVLVIGGDLNSTPGEPAIAALLAGGFVDTHVAAGNAECDAATGAECTSGRVDDSMADLTDPSSRQTERIDYLFVGGERECDTARPTGLFNAEAATATAGEIAFPADHTGVQATLECATTEAQREAAASATTATEQTTTTSSLPEVDAKTLAQISEAFSTLFGGDVTDVDRKLAALEDGELLRPFVLATYEVQKEIAARIRVRIDEVEMTDPTHASVTYTLLLDGAAVLDHLPGGAVKVGERWLVTRRTYCDVSTQGSDEIPTPCQ